MTGNEPKESQSASNSESATGNSEKPVDKRLLNLKPFKPGQSGNPSGRPKKKPITAALEAKIDAHADAIADCLIGLATGRLQFKTGGASVSAAKLISDRVEGLLTQRIEGTGKDGAIVLEMTSEEARARAAELTQRARARAARRG